MGSGFRVSQKPYQLVARPTLPASAHRAARTLWRRTVRQMASATAREASRLLLQHPLVIAHAPHGRERQAHAPRRHVKDQAPALAPLANHPQERLCAASPCGCAKTHKSLSAPAAAWRRSSATLRSPRFSRRDTPPSVSAHPKFLSFSSELRLCFI